LLPHGLALSDATAYNLQFQGSAPIFIDRLSLVPYVEGQHWLGHRQFCEQFLNPLLLRSLLGISHNEWLRGAMEGIPAQHLAKLVPLRGKLSWNVLAHVILQARLEASALTSPEKALERAGRSGGLSRRGFEGILRQLRNWISGMRPKGQAPTVWANYAHANTYSSEEAAAKSRFVRKVTAAVRPRTIIDLGCNIGDYSAAALESGAGYAVGFDFDQNALDTAFSRASTEKLPFLPLWLDASNPSPDQGWMQRERLGFSRRARTDALLALAFEHHLAIAKNVPLYQVLAWLIDIAPAGVIEFVPKEDPTVQIMLRLRKDIFHDYGQAEFEAALSARSRIIHKERVSASGRTLYWYSRAAK
jgi:ribosomal protein L11 methylase PrmA